MPSVTKGWSGKMHVQTAHCPGFYCPCCRARAVLPVFAVAKREGSTFVQRLAEQPPVHRMHLYMKSYIIIWYHTHASAEHGQEHGQEGGQEGFSLRNKNIHKRHDWYDPLQKLQKHSKDIKACLSTNFALECIYLSCLCSRHVQLYSESSGSLLVALLPAKLFSNKRPYLSAVSAQLCMTNAAAFGMKPSASALVYPCLLQFHWQSRNLPRSSLECGLHFPCNCNHCNVLCLDRLPMQCLVTICWHYLTNHWSVQSWSQLLVSSSIFILIPLQLFACSLCTVYVTYQV